MTLCTTLMKPHPHFNPYPANGTSAPQPKLGAANRLARLSVKLASAAVLAGCASVTPPGDAADLQAHDPWEKTNRKVFAFNESVDRTVVRPVAVAYAEVVPGPVRDSVGNFFGNLQDAWSAVNWGLQAQFKRGIEQGARFVVNSTAGVVGLFDVGRHVGLSKNPQDFGQTLGVWGVGMGPYVVLPILGPSSVRDSAALPLNFLASGTTFIDGTAARVAVTSLDLISQRSAFLAAEPTLNSIALDRYTFLRDAYLQRRSGRRELTDDKDFELVPPRPVAAASAVAASP